MIRLVKDEYIGENIQLTDDTTPDEVYRNIGLLFGNNLFNYYYLN